MESVDNYKLINMHTGLIESLSARNGHSTLLTVGVCAFLAGSDSIALDCMAHLAQLSIDTSHVAGGGESQVVTMQVHPHVNLSTGLLIVFSKIR